MTRARLPRQVGGRWTWLAAAVAAAAAATVLTVRRVAHGRSQADSTAVGTESAEAMAPGATAAGTRLRQAYTTASSRVSAAGGAVRRQFSRNGSGTPSEMEAAETAPAASTPAAASDHDEVPPSTGSGSAPQAPAAGGSPARDT